MDHEPVGASDAATDTRLIRPTALRATGGTLVTGAAVGAVAGTAAAWERVEVAFKSCREMWMVGRSNLRDDQPAVARATVDPDHGTDSRVVEFTADTPNSPSVIDADCVQSAYDGRWAGNDRESNCVDDAISDAGNGSDHRNRRTGRGAPISSA